MATFIMTHEVATLPGIEFHALAGTEWQYWEQLAGCAVEHVRYGSGKVELVEPRTGEPPKIFIRFGFFGLKSFPASVFSLGSFSSVTLPAELAKLYEEHVSRVRAKESLMRLVAEELEPLVRKYNIPNNCARSQQLLDVLRTMESRLPLDEPTQKWLKQCRLSNVLATYYFREYTKSRDLWQLVKTCSALRDARLPQKAIEISSITVETPSSMPSKEYSALLTTRAGALRDLGKLAEAMSAAQMAIIISPGSYHPHNLVGAILYSEGDHANGDRHFEIAIELGSSPRIQEFEIRTVLDESSTEDADRLIEHLISKDSDRFAWVQCYRQGANGV